MKERFSVGPLKLMQMEFQFLAHALIEGPGSFLENTDVGQLLPNSQNGVRAYHWEKQKMFRDFFPIRFETKQNYELRGYVTWIDVHPMLNQLRP